MMDTRADPSNRPIWENEMTHVADVSTDGAVEVGGAVRREFG